jgi:hypothetical protein
MKKIVFFVAAFAFGRVALGALEIDALIKNAVDSLVAGRAAAQEVSIAPLTVGDTEAVSELSAFLNGKIRLFAANNSLYRVVPETRALTVRTSKAVLTGEYQIKGSKVAVTLRLEAEIDGKRLKTASFDLAASELKTMGIDILPANYKTQKDAENGDALFVDAGTANPFALKIFGNNEDRAYYDGDRLRLTLVAEKNCYFKVYHIDVRGSMKLIYPNSLDTNNRLEAGIERTIPENTEFVLEAPYGEETILAVAAETPFENSESELLNVVPVSREAVAQAAATSRGLGVQVRAVAQAQTAPQASVRYAYTVMEKKNAAATVSYKKPADLAAFLAAVRSGILAEGGTWQGGEKEGTFSRQGLSGSYKVTSREVIFTFEQALAEPATRGMAAPYNFAFSRPSDIGKSLRSVQSEIKKKGGVFSGNEREGSFTASGIAGAYRVADNVNVSIYEKPWIVSNSLIEKEVKNYFLGK